MIFTFYSYKGGVGRSMTLANVAAWLRRQGLRVAMVDWDLEAPGLESFFFSNKEKLDEFASQVGIIDTLLGYKRIFPRVQKRLAGATTLVEKVDVLQGVLPPLSSNLSRIDNESSNADDIQPLIFTAGLRADDFFPIYAHNVQTFDWDDFYHTYEGQAYFEWMRGQLLSLADVVLIDSRTGLNEMSGVCAQQLADVVVSFCAANLQNLDGVVSMASSFTRPDLDKDRGRGIDVLIVPTRIDNFNAQRLNEFEEQFRARTARFTPTILATLKTDFWSLQLPYAPSHAYRESIVIGEPDADKTLEAAYKRLAVFLAMFARAESVLRRRMTDEIRRVIGDVLPRVVIVPGDEVSPLADRICARIESANLNVWPMPDRSRTTPAERGVAIAGILAQARVLVVPATAAALRSAEVRDAWRRARQMGVWVLPLRDSSLDATVPESVIADLPPWMRGVPVLSLDEQWEQVLDVLNRVSAAVRVPCMAQEPPADAVARPNEVEQLKSLLLGNSLLSPRVALYGLGGSGKTTLAKMFAWDDEVQGTFTGGILWLAAHEGVSAYDELSKVHLALTGEASTFMSAAEMWTALQPRLSAGRYLIVLDDLERIDRLREFGWVSSCCYLITTRDRRVAAQCEATPIGIGGLTDTQAHAMLATSHHLPPPIVDGVVEQAGTLPGTLNLLCATAASQSLTAAMSSSDPTSIKNLLALVDEAERDSFVKVLAQLDEIERERLVKLVFTIDDGTSTIGDVNRCWETRTADSRQTLTRLADLALITVSQDWQRIDLSPHVRRMLIVALPGADLGKVLDAAFARIPAGERDDARSALCRLVRVNDLAEIEARTIRREDLPDVQQRLLPTLNELDLVQLDTDATGGTIVSFANPAACRQWRQLRRWVDEDRKFLVWRQGLGARVQDRSRAGDQGALLSGALLREAIEWKDTRGAELSRAEREYIYDSRSGMARARRSRILANVAALISVLALLVGLFLSRAPLKRVDNDPSVASDPDVVLGDAAAGRGDPEAAIAAYSKALSRSPDNAELLYKRGMAYAHSNPGAAQADFTKALAKSPGRADIIAARGAARLDTGDRDGAIEDYTKAIQLDSSYAPAYFSRGGLYQDARNMSAAIADLRQVVKLSPDPLTVRAAQARLEKLGATPVAAEQTTVYVHYQDARDKTAVDEIVAALSTRGYRTVAPQRVTQTTSGDVRFVAQDRSTALAVGEAVQNALADRGYALRLRPIVLVANLSPAPQPGLIEVWLPSLADVK